ncbi:MAG: OmpA family protein [Edaphocola sp.]
MKMKFIVSAAAMSALALTTQAQDALTNRFYSKTKGSLIGFSANLTDYSASLPEIGKVQLGASLMYWKGLTPHLDFSIRLSGLFTDYSIPESEDVKPVGELEGALHLRLLSDDHLFNPFISAGVGAGTYSSSIVPYAPVGLGIQVNLFSETYLFLQGNYRFSFQDAKMHNSTFYSFGIAAPISYGAKKEPPAPPAPPAPLDTDGDGVADANDQCPNAAGLASLYGCPDGDRDGIADKDDKCPTVAGVAKYGGCPIPDTDKDGVNDESDKCPTVVGVAKYGGCPVPDTDGDGLNDEEDRCPTVAGSAANRGCPEVKSEVKKRLAFAATAIQFETGKAIIKKQSYKLLDEIAAILGDYPDYKLMVDGHTDNTGNHERNLELSKERAAAVKAYLEGKGVAPARIESTGHGDTVPVASNKTAAGRAKNRRVDLDLQLK